jgi:hypothetical protein
MIEAKALSSFVERDEIALIRLTEVLAFSALLWMEPTGIRIVTRASLEQRVLSQLRVMQPLNVIDLAHSGCLAPLERIAGC